MMDHDTALTLGIACVQLAATFGGVLAALKSHARGIDEAKDAAQRAHARLDDHLDFHLQKKDA